MKPAPAQALHLLAKRFGYQPLALLENGGAYTYKHMAGEHPAPHVWDARPTGTVPGLLTL